MFALRTTRALLFAVVAAAASLVWAPGAAAWVWPADGPVLRPFSLGDDPYAGGQHRGVDIGVVTATGIRAPASGQVTFAGHVPTHGLTVTITTADGHKASLTHVGPVLVRRGAHVEEGDVVAESGVSGEAEHNVPYVHLGVRVGASETYVDPLTLLPTRGTPSSPAAPPSTPPPCAGPRAEPSASAADSLTCAAPGGEPTRAYSQPRSGSRSKPCTGSRPQPGTESGREYVARTGRGPSSFPGGRPACFRVGRIGRHHGSRPRETCVE